jgi:hypothetical protein
VARASKRASIAQAKRWPEDCTGCGAAAGGNIRGVNDLQRRTMHRDIPKQAGHPEMSPRLAGRCDVFKQEPTPRLAAREISQGPPAQTLGHWSTSGPHRKAC